MYLIFCLFEKLNGWRVNEDKWRIVLEIGGKSRCERCSDDVSLVSWNYEATHVKRDGWNTKLFSTISRFCFSKRFFFFKILKTSMHIVINSLLFLLTVIYWQARSSCSGWLPALGLLVSTLSIYLCYRKGSEVPHILGINVMWSIWVWGHLHFMS